MRHEMVSNDKDVAHTTWLLGYFDVILESLDA